ncbi:MAG: methylmalonyl-CoA epimerase [Acidobacteria bacterium]|uniref:VOC domain-containing protein n=1 Tax=marine metagenome TaxID=408172 RepID=A0A381U608_9ZZZZ|nr:methylmalonyl-CoA epimerase [Acidobacteriota bacterium]|tara:strand:- start:4487 stop:4897 length:411 start_codon:yes stop_codon:yes gene_type:complete
MKATLDHVGIAVQDLNEALRFFRDVLGLQVSQTELVSDQQVRVTHVETSGASLEFLEATDPASPVARFLERRGSGLHHITLAVDDLESVLEDLQTRGIKLIDVAPRIGAGGSRIAFIHPSSTHGVLIELKQSDHAC